jgi:hypothetical protein
MTAAPQQHPSAKQSSRELLERALRYRHMAAITPDEASAAGLMQLALKYLERAEEAHRRETAGKEIRGR